MNQYGLNSIGGMIGGEMEGGFKVNNSVLYIKKADDENYYAVPHASKPLRKFLLRHFEDNTELISNLEKVIKLENVKNLVVAYNKWYTYQRKAE